MAKSNSRAVTPRSTNPKSNSNRSSHRPNPMVSKSGFTRSGRRAFGDGGKIK